jgi:ABC-2 type transport system permease protein
VTGNIASVYRAESRKLRTQLATRVLAVICVLGPFAFAGVLRIQSGSPADTLFGVWVHSTGFAVSLVVLGFAGAWGFPVIAGILAGDMFSSEDRYQTWKTVLTRSRTRWELFVGKVLAAATFTVGLLALTAISSLLAGFVLVGTQPLVGLGGYPLSSWHTLGLTLASWATCVLPMLSFTSIAVLFSVATRNGIIGVLGPALVALVMNLLALVGTGTIVHMLLISSAFLAWHALFTAHPYYGPLVIASAVSLIWSAATLSAAWLLLRRRDFAGTTVARRAGWVAPVRVAVVTAAVIALLAIATNWGPAGDTAHRLQATFTPAFNNLTLLQQRELGRRVPPGTKLNVVPTCSRRAQTPKGPGDWVCTMTVYIPQPGAQPFNPTPVSYDVSLTADGCYKAVSPPSFVGQQTMKAASGQTVVNPLFTIYGCFNTL